jgi:hypothetical protein
MAADATYTGNQRILAPATDKSACARAISGAEGKPIKCSTVLKRGLFISGTRTLARDMGNATHKNSYIYAASRNQNNALNLLSLS